TTCSVFKEQQTHKNPQGFYVFVAERESPFPKMLSEAALGYLRAGFDAYTGTGTGTYNGVASARAEWTFTDAGEPGRGADHMRLVIQDANNTLKVHYEHVAANTVIFYVAEPYSPAQG